MTRSSSPSHDDSGADTSSDEEQDSWVQCDKCAKWRRIPQDIADKLDDSTPWYCEHNPNNAFNNCNVPQELTNEEIDQDGKQDSDTEQRVPQQKVPAVWQVCKANSHTHRTKRGQVEDDIMICHCQKPRSGEITGCGPDCINRVLNIECVPEYCPCEECCTNQMFSRRQYAKLDVRSAGVKGFGLFADQDIRAGQFIIEYVGEVLDDEEYMRRKEYYLEAGQRHYYFMNVGNSEVIDACRKGNVARFINHSCDPNCETQKWVVRGEMAIGLFALRDVAKGDELTFDYNFERYGEKPLRCHCNTRLCRKFIGGSAEHHNEEDVGEPEDVVADPAPVMVTEAESDMWVREILDARVGLSDYELCHPKLLTRLYKLCKKKGNPWVPVGLNLAAQAKPVKVPPQARPAARADSTSESWTASKDDVTVEAGGGSGTATGPATRVPLKAVYKQLKQQEQLVTPAVPPPLPRRRHSEQDLPQAVRGALDVADESPEVAPAKPSVVARPTSTRPSTTASVSDSFASSRLHPPTRAPAPRRPATARPSNGSLAVAKDRKKTDVDRKLAAITKGTGRLRDTARQDIVQVLRMFNLCIIGVPRGPKAARPAPTRPHPDDAVRSSPVVVAAAEPAVSSNPTATPRTDNDTSNGSVVSAQTVHRTDDLEALGPARPVPSSVAAMPGLASSAAATLAPSCSAARLDLEAAAASAPPALLAMTADPAWLPAPTAQQLDPRALAFQRARMADLSLLLDVVLNTSLTSVKKELVQCGILSQLQQALSRVSSSKDNNAVVRKMLRVLENLPLCADDLYSARSAHGNLADTLRMLCSHNDPEVKLKAGGLLKKYPASVASAAARLPPLAPRRPMPPSDSTMASPGPNGEGPSGSSSGVPGSALGSPRHERRRSRRGKRRNRMRPSLLNQNGPTSQGGFRNLPSSLPRDHGYSPATAPLAPYVVPDASQHAQHKGRTSMWDVAEPRAKRVRVEAYPAAWQPAPPEQEWLHGHPIDLEDVFAIGIYGCRSYHHPFAIIPPSSAPPPIPGASPPAPAQGGEGPTPAPQASPPVPMEQGDGQTPVSRTSSPVPMHEGEGPGALFLEIPAQTFSPVRSPVPEECRRRPSPGPTPDTRRTPSPDPQAAARSAAAATSSQPSRSLAEELTALEERKHQALMQAAGSTPGPPSSSGRAWGQPPVTARQLTGRAWPSSSLTTPAPHRLQWPHSSPAGQPPPASTPLPPPPLPAVLDLTPIRVTPAAPRDASGQQPTPIPWRGVPASTPIASTPASTPDPWRSGVHSAPPSAMAPPSTGPYTHPMPARPPDRQSSGGQSAGSPYPETWDSPNAQFEAYVADTVRHRLGKYEQPDHPSRITAEESHSLFRKISHEVIQKERTAFAERQRAIDARKLADNIKEFVRVSIRRLHDRRGAPT